MTEPPPPALHPEVAAALRPPLFGYAQPLKLAWNWNRSGNPDDLRKASQLLAELVRKYPEQPVVYEQALNLVRLRRTDEALAILRDADQRFDRTTGEDILSLWGRIHKDRGDEQLRQAQAAGGDDRAAALAAAESAYREAESQYERAYSRHLDRFPGINLATLAFLRSGLMKARADDLLARGGGEDDVQTARGMHAAAADFLRAARTTAENILASRDGWVARLPDDRIWMAATAGEAALLLADWPSAAAHYAAALHPDRQPKPFHFDSIHGQVRRLAAGYARLGGDLGPPLAPHAAFFDRLARDAGAVWTAPPTENPQ